jgi:hypothetical protein
MAPSGLSMVADPRELRLDLLGKWLTFWTVLVVLGLILEYFDLFQKSRRFITIRSIDWTSLSFRWSINWLTVGEVLGGLLVTFGVAGELYVQFIASRVEHDLRTSSDSTIAKITSANLGLERILIPRRVTFDGMGKEFATLRPFAKTNVEVVGVPDLEAMRLASDIVDTLNAAGWTVQSVTLGVGPSAIHLPTGVRIVSSMDDPQHEAAWVLSKYLSVGYLYDLSLHSTAGIRAHFLAYSPTLRWWPSEIVPNSDAVFIFVGMKPIGEEVKDVDMNQDLPDKVRQHFDSEDIPWNPGEEWP